MFLHYRCLLYKNMKRKSKCISLRHVVPFSGTRRVQNISKNQNLYPHQSRITLFTLLWDTLYVLLYYTTLLETIIIDCNACYYGIYVVVCTGLKIWSGKVRNCTALIDSEAGTYLYFVVWLFWWTKSADFLFCKTGNTDETHRNVNINFWKIKRYK